MNVQPNRESCKAVYVPPDQFDLVRAEPGQFTIRDEGGRQTLKAVLPGRHYATCPVDAGGWKWNQSTDQPTLSPSVRVSIPEPGTGKALELWHGWLRNGEWVSC